MIRRDAGNQFFLITQDHHALLAGQLARRYGNHHFSPPNPREAVITGISLHDAGWPLHDDSPTLNDQHLPLDVFEVPRSLALKVWAASAERAALVDAYAGLLVSLHSLSLSIHAASHIPTSSTTFDVQQLGERFEMNKFQHREVERQEQLRQQLKFSTDAPLTHGLAPPGASGVEDQLMLNFQLLQAMDLISLHLCCTHLAVARTPEVVPWPGQSSVGLELERASDGSLMIDPWPFDMPRIELTVPYRAVPKKPFSCNDDLRRAYAAAKAEQMTWVVRGELAR